jgi:uncharacterized membrane protein affecting hemolysin expression
VTNTTERHPLNTTDRHPLRPALEHPADRPGAPDRTGRDRRGRFNRIAERASFLASSAMFFVLCAALVCAWALGFAFGASNRLEAVGTGLMSAVTLMLVALLKNAELRAERALQQKLDAIASSLLEDRRGDRGDAENQLERSIGVHHEI